MASAMAAASGLSEEVLERLASDPMSCVERVARYVCKIIMTYVAPLSVFDFLFMP